MTTSSKLSQSRNWAITDFDLLDWETIWEDNKDIIRYMCRGLEIAPTTGKKHYQGWIQFYNKKRMGGVKRVFNSKSIHVEPCRGNEYNNDTYCKKDNDYLVFGKFVSQGNRSDMEDIKKSIDEEVPMIEIANNHFFSDIFSNHFHFFSKFSFLFNRLLLHPAPIVTGKQIGRASCRERV